MCDDQTIAEVGCSRWGRNLHSFFQCGRANVPTSVILVVEEAPRRRIQAPGHHSASELCAIQGVNNVIQRLRNLLIDGLPPFRITTFHEAMFTFGHRPVTRGVDRAIKRQRTGVEGRNLHLRFRIRGQEGHQLPVGDRRRAQAGFMSDLSQ